MYHALNISYDKLLNKELGWVRVIKGKFESQKEIIMYILVCTRYIEELSNGFRLENLNSIRLNGTLWPLPLP